MTQQDCIMCWEEPRQATLAPCGHRALCASSSVTPKLLNCLIKCESLQ